MDESLMEEFSRDLFVNEVRKWEDLPTDCLVHIFEEVDTESLIENLPLVCKSWYKASLSPQCWKILDFSYLEMKTCRTLLSDEYTCPLFANLGTQKAIMFAVYRSCGKASKVVFPCLFIGENMLQYVLERCEELKSLIAKSYFPNELKCISKQIYKWKDLESLSIYNACYVKEILTEIYTHCTKFVSLSLGSVIKTEVASAIVTFVPNIKHLVLSSCFLRREDLSLILSGCRELELRDVTNCIGFNADDAEILTMAAHIKTFMSEGSWEEEAEEYYGDYADPDLYDGYISF